MVLDDAGRHHTPMLFERSMQRPAHVDWEQSATVLGNSCIECGWSFISMKGNLNFGSCLRVLAAKHGVATEIVARNRGCCAAHLVAPPAETLISMVPTGGM